MPPETFQHIGIAQTVLGEIMGPHGQTDRIHRDLACEAIADHRQSHEDGPASQHDQQIERMQEPQRHEQNAGKGHVDERGEALARDEIANGVDVAQAGSDAHSAGLRIGGHHRAKNAGGQRVADPHADPLQDTKPERIQKAHDHQSAHRDQGQENQCLLAAAG